MLRLPLSLAVAFLAVLALLTNPVAARAACVQAAPVAMAGMDMSATPMPGSAHVGAQKTTGGPCCDHSGRHRMSDKSCAQACAASCAVAAALPGCLVGVEQIRLAA